jgi:D-alanyl-lipoteichoic acid acyltransferase DltB (MBOAT superfamily)
MLFNSLDFAVFFPIVFALFWLLQSNLRAQNLLIVVSSYIFYGWWDWRFLALIFFSTIVDYYIGLKLENENSMIRRKAFLAVSLSINLGLLFVFKYYDFFLANLAGAFSLFGTKLHCQSLNIILPVGITSILFRPSAIQ